LVARKCAIGSEGTDDFCQPEYVRVEVKTNLSLYGPWSALLRSFTARQLVSDCHTHVANGYSEVFCNL
jgi:hypothetical protein